MHVRACLANVYVCIAIVWLAVRDELQLLIFSSIVLVMSKEVLVKNAVAVLTDVSFDDFAINGLVVKALRKSTFKKLI